MSEPQVGTPDALTAQSPTPGTGTAGSDTPTPAGASAGTPETAPPRSPAPSVSRTGALIGLFAVLWFPAKLWASYRQIQVSGGGTVSVATATNALPAIMQAVLLAGLGAGLLAAAATAGRAVGARTAVRMLTAAAAGLLVGGAAAAAILGRYGHVRSIGAVVAAIVIGGALGAALVLVIFGAVQVRGGLRQRHPPAARDTAITFPTLDAVRPVVTSFVSHHHRAAHFQEERTDFLCLETNEVHLVDRTQADGHDDVFETWLTINMGGDSLSGFVFVDNKLIRRFFNESFRQQPLANFHGKIGKRTNEHRRVNLSRLVVVSVTVMLNAPPKVIKPGARIYFPQVGLLLGEGEQVRKEYETRNPEMVVEDGHIPQPLRRLLFRDHGITASCIVAPLSVVKKWSRCRYPALCF
jgi:hypothetical protein